MDDQACLLRTIKIEGLASDLDMGACFPFSFDIDVDQKTRESLSRRVMIFIVKQPQLARDHQTK